MDSGNLKERLGQQGRTILFILNSIFVHSYVIRRQWANFSPEFKPTLGLFFLGIPSKEKVNPSFSKTIIAQPDGVFKLKYLRFEWEFCILLLGNNHLVMVHGDRVTKTLGELFKNLLCSYIMYIRYLFYRYAIVF